MPIPPQVRHLCDFCYDFLPALLFEIEVWYSKSEFLEWRSWHAIKLHFLDSESYLHHTFPMLRTFSNLSSIKTSRFDVSSSCAITSLTLQKRFYRKENSKADWCWRKLQEAVPKWKWAVRGINQGKCSFACENTKRADCICLEGVQWQ